MRFFTITVLAISLPYFVRMFSDVISIPCLLDVSA